MLRKLDVVCSIGLATEFLLAVMFSAVHNSVPLGKPVDYAGSVHNMTILQLIDMPTLDFSYQLRSRFTFTCSLDPMAFDPAVPPRLPYTQPACSDPALPGLDLRLVLDCPRE